MTTSHRPTGPSVKFAKGDVLLVDGGLKGEFLIICMADAEIIPQAARGEVGDANASHSYLRVRKLFESYVFSICNCYRLEKVSHIDLDGF